MELDAKQQAEFVRLLTNHQASLRSYIISLMPGMQGASDVLQETNVILWEKRHKFEIGTNFIAWAYAIARFEVMNHRRKLSKQGVPMLSDAITQELAEKSIETSNEFNQRLTALQQCLSRLSDDQQRLVEHRYYSDENLDFLARQTGRSCESLRVSLHRIRAALRRCIEETLNPIKGES